MKTKILIMNILLAGLLATVFYACKKDVLKASDEEENRAFMAVFRIQANTGNSADTLNSKVINTNDIYLTWNGVTGASGYHIKMKVQSGSWDRPADVLWDTILGPDVLKITKRDLQYSTMHNFALQTISPLGEAYNSRWYGLGDGSHPDDRADFVTGERPGIPADMVTIGAVTENSLRVFFDLSVSAGKGSLPAGVTLNPTLQYVDLPPAEDANERFIADEILVQPASVNRDLPTFKIKLTPENLANGYVDVTGLSSNALYVVNLVNNLVPRYWDRFYNTAIVRMKGQLGAPILIPHIVDNSNVWAQQNGASRLDTILNNYLFDNTLAEGTTYMLEAGKKYYLGSHVVLAKGLTIKSNTPGSKAIVLLGVGYNANDIQSSSSSNAYNFQLGRQAQAGEIGGILVGDVIFDDLSVELPTAVNFFNKPLTPQLSINGNYFINQHSASMPFTCSKLEVRNCNFQGMVRSWFRTQGTNRQVIENIIVDNCLFHDAGMYDVTGRGYPFITGAAPLGASKTNIFNNVVIKNNSFVGVSWDQLLRETTNNAWDKNVKWNITIENNTFLNAFSITNGRYLIQLQYPPAGSRFIVRKNLFISVKAAGDSRDFFQSGMDFRNYPAGLYFDVADNYSTSAKSANNAVTYFSGVDIINNNPFSSPSRGVAALNVGGVDASKVITGPTPIAPENLMVDPFPKGKKVGANWDTNAHLYNVSGLKFKNTSEVTSHPIYTKGIGDPRWR